MSWGRPKVPTESPTPAGLQPEDTATNEQAVPVGWWQGPDWRPLTWVVPEAYNIEVKEIRQKAGKGSSTVTGQEVWGDVAGVAGLGLGRAVTALEIGNEVIWTGNIVRNDNPAHPDYWRATIVTDRVKAYVYWGRSNQPVDDILLAGLGASNPDLRHPAYRNQILVVLKRCYFGASASSVPNVRLRIDRVPKPALGVFPEQASAQGESLVAGSLELATNPIFGAGMSAARFTAAEWEALSVLVIGRVGCHAPSLDRARPLRDVLRDFAEYYDGFVRIQAGKVVPGMFPHDGSVPAGLTELSVHDFTEEPQIETKTPAKAVNDLTVFCRDGADMLKKKPVSGSDSASVEAKRSHSSESVEMLGIIDLEQGSRFAAEAASTSAETQMEGEIRPRRARAIWDGGLALRAGDNFNLDYTPLELDQVSRIVKRTDPYRGSPTLQFVAERGVWPTPYAPPADLKPSVGKIVPQEIVLARVLELTPDMAGTPLGLPVGFIAKRPRSEHEDSALTSRSVLGFNAWYSPDGGSYDMLGTMPAWGVRGVTREALANSDADVTVKLTLDNDNLDLARLVAQSADGQLNDNLLVVVGEELFSVGAIAIAGFNYDLSCKRARLGSLPAGHGLGAEAWIVWRDEIRSFIHKGFIEDQNRYFKLQPYTQSAVLELAEVDPIIYHFRDRAPELPIIVLGALPVSPVVGVSYSIAGQISDVNGDLVSYQVQAVRLVASGGAIDSEITLQSGDVAPADKALKAFKAPLVFPAPGYWVIVVRAYDETGGFKQYQSAEKNVVLGTGIYGPDDGITPDPVSGVVLTGGLFFIEAEWANPSNTPILRVLIYANSAAVKPATPAATVDSPQQFLFFTGLPALATRYFWFEVEAKNGRKSAVAGPYNATTRAGVDLSDIVPGMELVGIVNALPNPVGYVGPKTILLTTDGKLYRYTGGAWTAAVPAVDLTGQIVSGQIADSAVLQAKLADNAVSQAKLQDGIISTSKLVDAAITAVKIGTGAITETKIADDAITTPKIAAGAVTAGEIAAGAVVAGKVAAGAISATELAAGSVTAAKIGAGEVTTAKLAAGAVTANELAANSVTAAKIGAGEVTTAKLAASAVTANELAANSVTAGKIAAAAVTAAAVGTNEIIANTANLAAAVVTGAKIADATIGTAKIGDGQITTAKIGDLQVSTIKIGDHAVTFPVSAKVTGPVGVAPNATVTVVSCNGVEVIGSEKVFMHATFQMTPVDNDTFAFRFVRSGYGILQEWTLKAPLIGADVRSISWEDTPGAGTYDYSLQIYGISPNSGTCNFAKICMFAMGTRK